MPLNKFIILLILLFSSNLFSHGFGKSVFVSLANGYYQSIDNMCDSAQTQKLYPAVLTYREKTQQYTSQKVKSVATSKTNCYFKIGFDTNIQSIDIICTPDQEFYSVTTNRWIPAYQLNTGDELLTKNNTIVPITYIEFVETPIKVFIIEIKKTHTFFVGRYAVLTHNIILPLCASISVPFGGITCGTIGSFFGPITFTAGIIAGSLLGTIIKIVNSDKVPQYKLPHYNASLINQYRNTTSHLQDKNNDAQAPGKPTAEDCFERPKRWDGKKIRNPNGLGWGWPDHKGHVWVPTGPNGHDGPHWDVQDPRTGKHRNVLPGGKTR